MSQMSRNQQTLHSQHAKRIRTPRLRSLSKATNTVAIDTETTGPDFFHGCKPFYVSLCTDQQDVLSWEWEVDPLTREPTIPMRDLIEIQNFLDNSSYRFVFHNAKFDMRALDSIGLALPHWDQVEDTIIASHVLASAGPHGLKDLALHYLDIGDEDEVLLKQVVTRCRSIAGPLGWDIAYKGHPHFPSVAKAEWWKLDMWIPRALFLKGHLPSEEKDVTSRYARMDAIRTLGLWDVFFEALEDENLLTQYRERVRLVQVVDAMETRGIYLSRERLDSATTSFLEKRDQAKEDCITFSGGYLENPNSPKQVAKVLYDYYQLPILQQGKTGPSTNKEVLGQLEEEYDLGEEPTAFIDNLRQYRKLKKSVEYLTTYKKGSRDTAYKGYLLLNPEFNITGTVTTRFNSRNPNAQNISKQEGFNLREVFGPTPGREWYALDYSNIEMRIFAYESGDQNLIDAFESGESVHLIFCEILHPQEYRQCIKDKVSFKTRYKATLYQNTKNGNFSLIYGASERRAELTYKVKGAYSLIRRNLPLIDKFIQKKYREGQRAGYVELLGGYRLQVPPTEPHKSCNYFVQGSAGWAINRAMNRVFRYLRQFPDHGLIMQVHDELVFDFPCHPANRKIVATVKRLMELSGEDIGIPLPVEADFIQTTWARGIDITPEL